MSSVNITSIIILLITCVSFSCNGDNDHSDRTKADANSIESLVNQLGSSDSQLRIQAANKLLDDVGLSSIPLLSDAVKGDDPNKRYYALRVLASIGPEALPILINTIADPHEMVPDIYTIASEIKWDASNKLKTYFNSDDIAVRDAAYGFAACLTTNLDSLIPSLIAAVHTEEKEKKLGPAITLGQIGVNGGDVVQSLVELLADDDKWVRIASAHALGNMGEKARDAVPQLMNLLNEDDAVVTSWAIDALEKIDHLLLEGVAPIFIRLLNSSDAEHKMESALSLGYVGDQPDVIDALIQGMGSTEPLVRSKSAISLGRIGPDAILAEAVLLRGLSDEFYEVRKDAATALGKISVNQHVVTSLIGLLDDDNLFVIEAAVEALGNIGPNAVVAAPKLILMIGGETAGYISQLPVGEQFALSDWAIVSALGNIGPAAVEAVPTLIGLLDGQYDSDLKISAAEAIYRIDPEAADIVDILANMLSDEDPFVRTLAAQTLGGIGPEALKALPALKSLAELDEDYNLYRGYVEMTALEAVEEIESGVT